MKTKSLMLVAAFAAVVTFTSVRAEYVFDQTTSKSTGGGLKANRTWKELSTAFSLGLWVKNVTAEWGLYYADMGVVTLNHVWSGDTATWPRDNVFYKTTQVDAVSGTNVTTYLKVPTTAYCRYAKTTDQPTAVDGKWHHLVITFNYDADDADNCFMRFYVDGVLGAESKAVYGPLETPTKNLFFGGDTGGNWGSKTLRQAEVTLWNRALSGAEIATLATRRAAGNELGLIGYWSCNNPNTYEEPNGAKGGVSAMMYGFIGDGKKQMVDDPDFPLANVRCVVSPAWAKAQGYVQSADASFRTWDDPATNIQDAVNQTSPGARVLVRKGTYLLDETLIVSNRHVIVRSYDPDNGGATDRDGTILDGQNARRVVYVSYGDSTDNRAEIDGFTIRNGYIAGSGGGAYLKGSCKDMTTLHLRGRFVNCLFTNNVANAGIDDNGGGGGAINLAGGYVSNCVFIANYASGNGGAIRMVSFDAGTDNGKKVHDQRLQGCPAAYNCAFTNNIAGFRGGAVADNVTFTYYCFVLEDCDFYGNMVSNGVSGTRTGFHVALPKCSYMARCRFHAPGSSSKGGNLYGSLVKYSSYSHIIDCLFENGNGGFGAVSGDGTDVQVWGCVFRDNTIDRYGNGALHISSATDFRNCLFADNAGSGVYQQGGGSTYYNCTFVGNSRVGINLGEYHQTSTSRARVYNCIFSGNADGSILNGWSAEGKLAYASLTNVCLQAAIAENAYTTVGGNVIVGAPGFKDAANDDYSLRRGSCCRDKGAKYDWMTDESIDLVGHPRLVNRDGVAYAEDALPDLGCYEIQERAPGMMLLVR